MEHSHWQVADYLLHGRHADLADVSRAAGHLRAALNAKRLLVLPLAQTTIYGSLAGVATDEDSYLPLKSALEVAQRFAIFREFARSHDTEGLWSVLRDVDPALRSSYDQDFDLILPTQQPTQVEVELLALGWPGRGQTIVSPHATDLVLALSCTVAVVARSADTEITNITRLVRRLEPTAMSTRVGSAPGHTEDVMRRLAELAREATRSDWAAIYLPSGPTRLGRVAVVGDETLEESLDAGSDTSVARALRTGYTFLGGGQSQIARISPTPGGTELIVPILETGDIAGANGVLVVGRRPATKRDDADVFTQYDAALARNVVLRAAALSSQSFSAAVMDLISRASAPPSPVILESASTSRLAPADIPADFELSKHWLQEIVDVLSMHPHVQSAAIRLISSDWRRLVRVAIAPIEREPDSERELSVTHRASVVALVFRSGAAVYLPNLDRKSDYLKLGLAGVLRPAASAGSPDRQTNAELCLPIKVNGQTVGTLNCESSRKDALGTAAPAAQALASLAGHIIERTQHSLERHVLELGSRLFTAAHALAHVSDDLRTVAQADRAFLDSAALTIVKSLELGNASDLYQLPLVDDFVEVEDLLRQLEEGFSTSTQLLLWKIPRPERSYFLSPRRAKAFYFAVREVLHNALHNSPRDPLGRARASLAWDSGFASSTGEPCFSVDIENRLRPDVEVDIGRLFRMATGYHTGRLHVGAFAAGVLLRSVGGELWVADATDEFILVRAAIPCEPSCILTI